MGMSLLTPEQEEAMLQMFLESRARDEAAANQRRFEAGKFALDLMKADDEAGGGDLAFQQGLSRFSSALRADGIAYSQAALALDGADAHGFPLSEFVMAMKTLGAPTITAIAGYAAAWVQGRSGRKVRLKIGEIEAEGRTVAEIEHLLDKAASFQDAHKGGCE